MKSVGNQIVLTAVNKLELSFFIAMLCVQFYVRSSRQHFIVKELWELP